MLRLPFLLLSLALLGQNTSPLSGVWTLNRPLSELSKEIGFNIDLGPATAGDSQPAGASGGGGGRGRRGSTGGSTRAGGGSPFSGRRESYEESQRLRLITADARNPASRLTLVDNIAAVIITNELGQSRTLHPNGKEESIDLEGVPVPVTSIRDGDKIVALYHVEQDRDVRYIYSSTANPSRLVVEMQFLEKGSGDKATRIYDAGTVAIASAPSPAGSTGSSAATPSDSFDQRPGAEFKGLKSMGVLVEDFGADALSCGLKQDAVEDAVSKRLTAAGLNVRKNSDDDTYVYVNVATTQTGGTCVSRYDAFLYTHATATLSYRERPVLVQVSLAHRGGIGSSISAAHAAAITRGLEGYIDGFISQIRDANK